MAEAQSVLESSVVDGQLKRLITDGAQVASWKTRLSNVKSEAALNEVLAQMYSNPEVLINFQTKASKFFDVSNIKKNFPELLKLSAKEGSLVLSKAAPVKLKNARVSDCYGDCSEDFNIAHQAALDHYHMANLVTSIFQDFGGKIMAMIDYYVDFHAALSTLESCTNRCNF
jgi:hypothetical protein